MKDQDEVQQEAIRTLAKMASMHTNYPGGSNTVDQYTAKQQEEKIRQTLASGGYADIPALVHRQSKPSLLKSFLMLLAMVGGVYLLINLFSQL